MIAIELNTLDWTLIGILAALFIAQVYFYGRYMAAPARRLRRDKKKGSSSLKEGEESLTPGVSVILAAHNEGDNLANYLQALLTQDWPEYEVIVVDDESEDNTRAVVESYMVQDPRLRLV